MADSASQGRGRGRGRAAARGQQPQQQSTSSTGRAVTRTPQPTAGAGGGAPPPGFQRPPPQQQQPQAASHRASHRGTAGDASAGVLQSRFQAMGIQGDRGNGDGGTQIGRGNMRGRRELSTVVYRTRPETCVSKKGATGAVLTLNANYFKILTRPDFSLYHYHVDFAPAEDRTFVRKALLRVHKDVIGPAYIFDGGELYTQKRLSPDPIQLYSKRNNDDANIQLTIKLTTEVRNGDPTYLQILNIIIRKCLQHLNLTLLNRNYYDAEARKIVQELNLELWPGYLTSMRQHDEGVLLCTEIIHKVLRKDTAYDLLDNSMRESSGNYKERYKADVVGKIVMTQYGNTETYRVDDVDFSKTPKSTFDFKGQKITFIAYYKQKYGVTIMRDQQPLLVSRPSQRAVRSGKDEPILLIPELCKMTGLTDSMRSDNRLMRSLADITRLSAGDRVRKLREFSERFHSKGLIKQELQEWNMTLDKNIVQFNGRQLPPERIILGGNKSCPSENSDWTNGLRSNPLLVPGQLDHWVVIVPRKFSRDTMGFLDMIKKAANGMRFTVSNPKIEEIQEDRSSSVVECLDRVLSRDKPKLVLCVVSNNKADRYSAIKKKTTVDRPVPSQVLVQKTMTRKGAMSVATKVAIQLSCKIGGAPWSVDMPLAGLMVVGYDVCHDSQSSNKSSYGAMVASLNKSLSRYFSTVTAHREGEELFNDLALNIGKAVQKYKEINGALPARIAIYRDGVGEGQIPQVVEKEVMEVKRALDNIYGGMEVKMAFIIVTKRLNTRFFCRGDNPPAGTIVDDCITHPEKYDFFLISQSVRQGSVSPTGFNVIYDTIALDADKLQRLTYKLTHLYYNWSGTVRVPAPCQYAHKLAFLVAQNLHRTPNPELEDLLYFL